MTGSNSKISNSEPLVGVGSSAFASSSSHPSAVVGANGIPAISTYSARTSAFARISPSSSEILARASSIVS